MRKESPLRYVNRSILTVHTSEGLAFCQGKSLVPSKSKSPWQPNIFTFGVAVNKIWLNAKEDDPYAEYALIQIEKKLEKAANKLALYERLARRMKKRWNEPEGLNIQECEAIDPFTITIGGKVFNSPHAKSLIVVVARYDALIRQLKSYRQFNIIKNKRFHTIVRRCSRSIQAVILETRSYKATGVTRYDIFNKTKRGKEAVDQLGMIPLSILNRDERSDFGPTPLGEKRAHYAVQRL